MLEQEVEPYFCTLLKNDPNKSPALAAIETLFQTLRLSKSATVRGLTDELRSAVDAMRNTDYSTTSVDSASELFMRFISLASLDQPNFLECKKILVDRGEQFLARVATSRQKICKKSQSFIKNNCNILAHSYSRVVCMALIQAAGEGKSFHVFITESQPDGSGHKVKAKLSAVGIPCTVIVDGAVGYIMERIDFVLVGAEGVMETGGIINKIGTLSIAMCAKATNKPVYVMAESIKFVKEYPLSQKDIPDSFKYPSSILHDGSDLSQVHPLVDYTPPTYIKLLFTDLGILTPAAISDELIKLYL